MTRLLATTCNPPRAERPGLYRINADTGETHALATGSMRGLAAYKGGHITIDHNYLYRIDGDHVEAIGWIPGLKAGHGVYVEADRVWINSTSENTVLVVNLTAMIVEETLAPMGTQGAPDVNHINSLWLDGDDLYLSMLAWDPAERARHWRGPHGAIARFDRQGRFQERVASDLCQPHTLCKIGGAWHWCESMTGRVYRDGGVLFEVDGYARGIARDAQHYYIGLSYDRHRKTGEAGVMVVRRDDFADRRFIPLDAEGVFDIRVLDEGA